MPLTGLLQSHCLSRGYRHSVIQFWSMPCLTPPHVCCSDNLRCQSHCQRCVAAGLSLEEVQELFNAKHGSAPGLQAGETDLEVVAA